MPAEARKNSFLGKIRLSRKIIYPLLLSIFVVQGIILSIVIPPASGPDEAAHIINAAADVRGEFVKKSVVPGDNQYPIQKVTIPQTYALLNAEASCINRTFHQPANCHLSKAKCYEYTGQTKGCGYPILSSNREVTGTTYTGRYPLLYYLIVGIPTLFTNRASVLYLMRFTSVLLDSIFIALALYVIYAWSSNKWLLVAFVACLVPTASYLISVVNPQSLEISTALCVWISGMVLVREKFLKIPKSLLLIFGISTIFLLLSRPDAPEWTLLIYLVLLISSSPGFLKRLLKDRLVYVLLSIITIVGLFSAYWIFHFHSDTLVPAIQYPHNANWLYVILAALGFTRTSFQELIGVLGWNNIFAPYLTVLIWLLIVGFLVCRSLFAIRLQRTRDYLPIIMTLLMLIFIPVVYSLVAKKSEGFIIQGRYTLPAFFGVVITSCAVFNTSNRHKKTLFALVTVLVVASLISFLWIIPQFEYGSFKNFIMNQSSLHWSPPFSPYLLFFIYLMSYGVLIVVYKNMLGVVRDKYNGVRT